MSSAPWRGGRSRTACLALNIAFLTTHRFKEMQTQPLPDPHVPTARAHPSLPHTPLLTLTCTNTLANAHARSRAPPHTQAPLVQPGIPTLGARPPASGAPLASPHARARTHSLRPPHRAEALGGSGGGGKDRLGSPERCPQSIPRSASASCLSARRLRAPLRLPKLNSWR